MSEPIWSARVDLNCSYCGKQVVLTAPVSQAIWTRDGYQVFLESSEFWADHTCGGQR